VWQPSNLQWWILVIVSLLIVFVWPPSDDKSLALKFTNWIVDVNDELPVLPGPLSLSEGDDVNAVTAHDQQVQYYDELYDKGGWTRMRLELKVADDPFNKSTERQLLTGMGVLTAFLVWRFGARKV
jgi:hypothetical protein